MQGLLFLEVVGAVVAGAFVNRAVGTLFPAVEGAVAVRAPVTSFRRAETRRELRQATTDLAVELRDSTTIVEVEKIPRGAAMRTTASSGQSPAATSLDRPQRPSVDALVNGTQPPPVELRRWGRRLGERRLGIDVKIAVVRMLLSKIIAGMNLGFAPSENLLQLLDEVLQVLASKFPAEPEHQTCYVAHGGESLGNLAGSLARRFWKRETTPPFSFPIKAEPAHLTPPPLRPNPNPKTVRQKSGGESRNPALAQQFKGLAA